MSYRELPPGIDDRVVAYTRAGHSSRWIAETIGCSERTVHRIRHQSGIAQPTAPPLTAQQLTAAEALLDDGASYTEVARTLSCSPSTIADKFPGRGWTPQQRGNHVALLRYLGREVFA